MEQRRKVERQDRRRMLTALATGRILHAFKSAEDRSTRLALASVRWFDPFRDPLADILFDAGILKGGLIQSLACGIPSYERAAGTLYSKLMLLYPMWMDLTGPQATKVNVVMPAMQNAPQQAAAPLSPEEREEQHLRDMLRESGYSPDITGMSLEEFAQDLRRKVADAR